MNHGNEIPSLDAMLNRLNARIESVETSVNELAASVTDFKKEVESAIWGKGNPHGSLLQQMGTISEKINGLEQRMDRMFWSVLLGVLPTLFTLLAIATRWAGIW